MNKADLLFKEFNKKFKEELCTKGKCIQKVQRIPFSSPRANYILYGGIPRGRLTEFAGEESGGKTTTSLDIVSNAQKLFKAEYDKELADLEAIEKPNKTQTQSLIDLRDRGPLKVLWIDAENTFDEEWATKLGVIVDEVYFISPQAQSAEQIFEITLNLIDTGEFGLVVIDSFGSMLSQQAYEKTIEEKTYGGIALALTSFSKKAEMSCARTNCALIGINQLRENMNAGPYGPSTTTPGGKAWKHHCSVRISFRKADFFDDKYVKVAKNYENPYGNKVQMNVVKTKVCKPDRTLGFYTLEYNNGINKIIDLIDMLIKYNVIQQGGAWFTFVNPETGEIICDEENSPLKVQGQKNLPTFLTNHPDLLSMYEEYINNIIEGN